MSNHKQKYPGLYARCKAAHVGYQVMYMRCRGGMTVDEALALPVNKPGRQPKTPRPLPEPVRKFLWERPEWNAKAALDHKQVVKPRMIRQRITSDTQDTAPAHIRRIRERYCDHFIKTGVLDDGMAAQLRAYADEQRSIAKHPPGVPDEPAARRYSRRGENAGDDSRGDARQIDGATAKRIGDFLRSI